MSESQNKLPIGLLLQTAGLITAEQLEKALEVQKQYSQMKLGEILVLQQGIKVKTINFFVDRWQEILAQGQILPIGYYLQQACLLNTVQIELILQEQKNKRAKFGELVVEKGWLPQETIDFFLNSLSTQPPAIITLKMLEEYNSQALHLEKKYANYSLILSRILAWTGGIPVLTKVICQVFAKFNSNIPSGQEIKAVDNFVEGRLIRKWRTEKAASSIRTIAASLLNNPRCDSNALLLEYQRILLAGEKVYDRRSPVQQELLRLGLILLSENRLRVSNIIYQQIFDRDFIIEQLEKLESQAIVAIGKPEPELNQTIIKYEPEAKVEQPIRSIANLEDIAPKATNIPPENTSSQPKNNSPEPLTKIGSIITGVAIALLIPLFLTINNYYSSLSNPAKSSNNPRKLSSQIQSCDRLNPADLGAILTAISELETTQQQQQDFPERCQTTLDRLRVMAAPKLGKESRILEAIRYLCKVPAESEMYIEAEVWLKRWYRSANWGAETKFYLEETDKYNSGSCPAAHFTEYEI